MNTKRPKRPWSCLYTKDQVSRALGCDIPVPSKGKASKCKLPKGSSYDYCIIEWTDQKNDYGKRLYKLTQYNEEK